MMEVTLEQAVAMRDGYCQQLEAEQQTFLNVVKAMPDEKLGYTPHDKIMDFATQARHIAGSGRYFWKMIEDGQPSMDEPPAPSPTPSTTTELVAELEPILAESLEKFRSFSGDQLAKTIDFFGMGPLPGACYINWDIVHLIHHRAQMALYLRIADEKVPSIYGPTADVSFEDIVQKKCADA